MKIHQLKQIKIHLFTHASGLNPYIFSYFCGVNISGIRRGRGCQVFTLMVL